MPKEPVRDGPQRPEEILARTFGTPLPYESSEGWSPRGRRFFLAAMALAGAILVTAGLLLTGELGPGPGQPRPLETGPDASVLANQLLRPVTEQGPEAPAASPTTGPENKGSSIAPVFAPPTAPRATAAPTPGPTAGPSADRPATQDETKSTPTTSTTAPCTLLGTKGLSAAPQLPPLCR